MKEKLPKLVSKINTSRTIALVLSLLLCISIIGIIASAASVTKDGLEVTLVTDKEEYSVSEPITATLTVENKSDKIIDKVNLEALIPDGYHIESSSTATKYVGQIGIGEKAVLSVAFLPNSSTTPESPVTPGTVTPETPSDDGKVSSNSDTDKENNGQSGNSKSSSTSSTSKRTSNSSTSSNTRSTPLTSRTTTRNSSATYSETRKVVKNADTGDRSNFLLWIILGVFSLSGLITVLIQKHNSYIRNGFFSVVLIASMLVGLFGMIPIKVKAEESIDGTLTVAKSVVIGKNTSTIEGMVILKLLDSLFTTENENGDVVYRPNDDHCMVDEDTGIEYFDNLLYAFTYEKLSNEEKQELAQKIDGSLVGTLKGDINYLQFKVKNSTLQQLKEKAAVLNRDDRVLFASFDYPRRFQNDDNNPWPDSEGNKEIIKGDEKNPAGNDWWAEAVHAYTAWDYIDSDKTIKEPIIGILDDGFYEHEDLTNTIYYQDFSSAYPKEHGTHVAGLVGAANNSVGIRGVSDLSTLILAAWGIEFDRYDSNGNIVKDKDGNPVKKNYLSGGQYVSITKQLIEHGAKVVNNSWNLDPSVSQIEAMKKDYVDHGGDKEKFFEEWLDTAQKEAVDSLGIIVSLMLNDREDFIIVQSAGNGIKYDSILDNLIKLAFPELFPLPAINSLYSGDYCSITQHTFDLLNEDDQARLLEKGINFDEIKNHIVIVGAVKNQKDENGHYLFTDFSNYGNNVDICAPGDDVLSTVSNNGYEKKSGTSMAAPIVSGAISVLWGMNPSLSAGEIKQLVKTTDQYGIGVGLDSGNFYPMLNLAYAIEHSPYYEKLKDDEQPSTPGDISGIDDPEPSQDNNGHYYKVFDEGLTWDEAREKCEQLGGHLATISSQEEQLNVEMALSEGTKNNYWLGGNQEGGSWTWITSEEWGGYTNWAPGMPDNWADTGNEDKLMLYRVGNPSSKGSQLGHWNDLHATGLCGENPHFGLENMGYVCEWDSEASYQAFLQRQPNAYEINMESSIEIDGKMETLTEQSFILDGHRYQLYQSYMKYLDTEQYLEDRNCHLATFSSKAENDSVSQYTRKYTDFVYIGLSDYKTENSWEWVDGTPLLFENWVPGEPNNEGNREDWAGLRSDGLWNDGKWDYDVRQSRPIHILVEWDSVT